MPYLVIVSFVWGFSFVLIKGSLVSLDSNFVSFARLLLSFIVFIPFMRPAGVETRDRLLLMLVGSVQFGFMYVAYVAAYQYLPAHTIVLLTTTTPLFVTIFNAAYDRRMHKAFLLAALLAVAGGAVLVYPDRSLSAGVYGMTLVQISNAAFAFGQIAYKKFMAARPGIEDRHVFGFLYAGAVLIAAVFSAVTTDYARLSVLPHQWFSLLYLGIVASGICFFLWNLGVRKVHAGALAVMNNLKIPVGVVASLMILGENADYRRLVVGGLLFASALWINKRNAGPGTDSRPAV